jgi:hypothetical protein
MIEPEWCNLHPRNLTAKGRIEWCGQISHGARTSGLGQDSGQYLSRGRKKNLSAFAKRTRCEMTRISNSPY